MSGRAVCRLSTNFTTAVRPRLMFQPLHCLFSPLKTMRSDKSTQILHCTGTILSLRTMTTRARRRTATPRSRWSAATRAGTAARPGTRTVAATPTLPHTTGRGSGAAWGAGRPFPANRLSNRPSLHSSGLTPSRWPSVSEPTSCTTAP